MTLSSLILIGFQFASHESHLGFTWAGHGGRSTHTRGLCMQGLLVLAVASPLYLDFLVWLLVYVCCSIISSKILAAMIALTQWGSTQPRCLDVFVLCLLVC